jgi:histone acetyltransferase (RNA polymerase elongator complex component)
MSSNKSAVKIFPVFIPFAGCKNHCIYCQQNLITRTISPDFQEIRKRLAFFCQKQSELRKEIAFFGGSFTLLSKDEQQLLFNEISEFVPLTDGIRISTRPDGIESQMLLFLRNNQVKTIELGIQSLNDQVLRETGRPYSAAQAMAAAKSVKDDRLQLGIQLMPGLPGETKESLEETIFRVIECKPDFVRIYPTLVLRGTELAAWHKAGRYKPLSLEEAIGICAEMKQEFGTKGIRVIKMGLHSDLSSVKRRDAETSDRERELPETVIAGPYHPAFGELVSAEILFRKIRQLYKPGKTLLISAAAVSIFRRDNGLLLKRIKKCLTVTSLPISIQNKLEKEEVLLSGNKAELLW